MTLLTAQEEMTLLTAKTPHHNNTENQRNTEIDPSPRRTHDVAEARELVTATSKMVVRDLT
jgi:hypothetical protein